MSENLKWVSFDDIDCNDIFFESLKKDYPGFEDWYMSKKDRKALTYFCNGRLSAFLSLKEETEEICLNDKILPNILRIKISTLKIDATVGRQRLGEGFIGVALWNWQKSAADEIYVTIFPKHQTLIDLLEKFGFKKIGVKRNGEYVLLKSKKNIDYSNAYSAFPFVNPFLKKGGIIPINDKFHDRLFPYSDTVLRPIEVEESVAGNGVTKIYIGTPYTATHYSIGDLVFIYRIYTGNGAKGNRSVITSYCTVNKITVVKHSGTEILSFEEYIKQASNKTVFSSDELSAIYHKNANVIMVELIYNGFFEKGNNVSYWQLKNNGMFENHPYNIDYSLAEIKKILELGKLDVSNIIVD